MCSIFGETDGTIASQIHPFSALFWRAKASWVSWRRPDVPVVVLTVSCRGAVSSVVAKKVRPARPLNGDGVKIFAQRGQNGQKWAFYSLLGEFFHGCGRVKWLLGESCLTLRHRHQAPNPSTGTEARPSRVRCPPRRRNRPRTRIGYCDMDRS